MQTYTARLKRLTCKGVSDINPSDEVWMMIQSDAGGAMRYPFTPLETISLKKDEYFDLKNEDGEYIEVVFSKMAQILIWDQDFRLAISDTDYLGSTGLTKYSLTGSRRMTNGKDSEYYLDWEQVGGWPDVQ